MTVKEEIAKLALFSHKATSRHVRRMEVIQNETTTVEGA